MPTLKEFIRSVLQKENIHGDVDKIAKEIEKKARKQAVNGIACICDEEVREMTINIAELMLKDPDAYKEDKPKPKKVEKVIQVRGEGNKDPGPNIESFVSKWAEVFNIKYSGKQPHFEHGNY